VEIGKIEWPKHGHDLGELVKQAGVMVLDEKNVELLRRLSQAVLWQGRYPVTKAYDAKSGRVGMNIPEDYVLIDGLQRKLLDLALAHLPPDAVALLKATWEVDNPSSD
jgi:hypothetical protein